MDSAKPSAACDVTQSVATISTSSFDTPGATILATSAAVAFLIFLTTGPVHFSDSSTYFAYSIAMSHFTVDTDAWFRTAGYPLLITATLYPWTFSMIGVLAVQALLAALIPWLIYRILLYARSTPFAVFGALLSNLTLLRYQFQNLLYSDQAEMFLGILFCYLLIRFQFSPNTKNMIWMFLAYAYVSFFRPPLRKQSIAPCRGIGKEISSWVLAVRRSAHWWSARLDSVCCCTCRACRAMAATLA